MINEYNIVLIIFFDKKGFVIKNLEWLGNRENALLYFIYNAARVFTQMDSFNKSICH